MDKNEKFLRSLSRSLRDKVEAKLTLLLLKQLDDLDVKKLKGNKGYRVRVGKIRILFRLDQNKNPEIFFVGFRDSVTYSHHC